MPPSKNLLLCFDAFGTLFAPKRPVHQQYGQVARALGLGGFTDDDVKQAFKAAFKKESQRHPNYGKTVGMNPQSWWSNIITNTFQPLLGADKQLPSELVPQLLHRFWSDEGYTLLPGVQTVLGRLTELKTLDKERRTVVGVITNSDDRVPDILQSLGISVSPVRHGSTMAEHLGDSDIDFVVMSFDVGHEKPSRRIFTAAEDMLQHTSRSESPVIPGLSNWQKIYIGDEYEKDIRGAQDAGWNAVLVGARDERVRWLDEETPGKLAEALEASSAVGFSNMGMVGLWLR